MGLAEAYNSILNDDLSLDNRLRIADYNFVTPHVGIVTKKIILRQDSTFNWCHSLYRHLQDRTSVITLQ